MKKFLLYCSCLLATFALSACLASASSPDGLNCDYSQGRPLWQLPAACQGN